MNSIQEEEGDQLRVYKLEFKFKDNEIFLNPTLTHK